MTYGKDTLVIGYDWKSRIIDDDSSNIVIDSLLRRLTTSFLPHVDDANVINIRDYVNSNSGVLNETLIKNVVIDDDRIEDAEVVVTEAGSNTTITVKVTLVDSNENFELIIPIQDVSLTDIYTWTS